MVKGEYAGTYSPVDLCFGNGRFVAVGQGLSFGNTLIPAGPYVGTSTDGTNWIAQTLDTDSTLFGVCCGAGLYVAVGRSGMILTSPDGIEWTRRNHGPTRNLLAIAPVGDGFVAAGNMGVLALSSNGLVWDTYSAPSTNVLRSVLHAGGRYVFTGDAGTILSGSEITNLTICSVNTAQSLWSVAFGANAYVTVGNSGAIARSADGLNWSAQVTSLTDDLRRIIFARNMFVTVGNRGTILTSTDGIAWTSRSVGLSIDFYDVAFGNERFVVTSPTSGSGDHGAVSLDGINWTPVSGFNPYLSGIAFGNGLFLVPDATFFGVNVSTDGIHWTKYAVPRYPPALNQLAFNNGTFVAAGNVGAILQSDPIVHLTSSFDGVSHVVIEGVKNAAYRIEGNDSGAPTDWNELTVLSSPPYTWTDPESAGRSNRLYRAVLLR